MIEGGEAADERLVVLCVSCLIREVRPGSVYCSRLCRFLYALRRLGAY
jgi:hypothetical protein